MGSEWILGRLAGGVDSVGSGWRKVEGSCERGDEPSGSGATELGIYLVSYLVTEILIILQNENVLLLPNHSSHFRYAGIVKSRLIVLSDMESE
jgi:hypothetical protein